jgi:HSP20 family protein
MNPFDDWNKRRKTPFDTFNFDEEFYEMFREMERMMERAFRDFNYKMLEPGKPFVYGYNIRMRPDGKPEIQEFGNKPIKQINGSEETTFEREPLTDIIEGTDDVSVTIEIPGVDKENIDLRVYEDSLEITVDDPTRNYHRLINLPCAVFTESINATYKNGILDIQIKKKQKSTDDSGYRIPIN